MFRKCDVNEINGLKVESAGFSRKQNIDLHKRNPRHLWVSTPMCCHRPAPTACRYPLVVTSNTRFPADHDRPPTHRSIALEPPVTVDGQCFTRTAFPFLYSPDNSPCCCCQGQGASTVEPKRRGPIWMLRLQSATKKPMDSTFKLLLTSTYSNLCLLQELKTELWFVARFNPLCKMGCPLQVQVKSRRWSSFILIYLQKIPGMNKIILVSQAFTVLVWFIICRVEMHKQEHW